MRILLKILGISEADIAKRLNVSRQAVWQSLNRGAGPPRDAAELMIEEARGDLRKVLRALEAREALKGFLKQS